MRRTSEKRGNWYLLTGLILGLALGLVYAWVISPVVYIDAGPSALREDFKEQYRLLVALAFLADDNFPRAQARLNQLKDPDIAATIAMQAQRSLADGRPETETRALGLLAVMIGGGPEPTLSNDIPLGSPSPQIAASTTPTPLLAAPTNSPTVVSAGQNSSSSTLFPTFTPLPTRTPTATPGAPFLLDEQSQVCDPNQLTPLLQVILYDASGQQVPGVEVIVTWDGHEEHFYTGLKPELGLGYADYAMAADVTYALRLADGGEPVTDLLTPECEAEDGGRFYGSWLLIFTASGR